MERNKIEDQRAIPENQSGLVEHQVFQADDPNNNIKVIQQSFSRDAENLLSNCLIGSKNSLSSAELDVNRQNKEASLVEFSFGDEISDEFTEISNNGLIAALRILDFSSDTSPLSNRSSSAGHQVYLIMEDLIDTVFDSQNYGEADSNENISEVSVSLSGNELMSPANVNLLDEGSSTHEPFGKGELSIPRRKIYRILKIKHDFSNQSISDSVVVSKKLQMKQRKKFKKSKLQVGDSVQDLSRNSPLQQTVCSYNKNSKEKVAFFAELGLVEKASHSAAKSYLEPVYLTRYQCSIISKL